MNMTAFHWLSFLIGVAVGYVVLPLLLSFIGGHGKGGNA